MSEKQIKAPRPLSIEETYAQRPRRWWVYTLIVLVVALVLFWSASGIRSATVANPARTSRGPANLPPE